MPNYHKRIAATIAKDASASSAIDLGGWNKVAIETAAQYGGALDDSTEAITITGSHSPTGVFLPIITDGTANLPITAAIVTLGNGGTAWPRYIKINADTTATAAAGYLSAVHVMDS